MTLVILKHFGTQFHTSIDEDEDVKVHLRICCYNSVS